MTQADVIADARRHVAEARQWAAGVGGEDDGPALGVTLALMEALCDELRYSALTVARLEKRVANQRAQITDLLARAAVPA